MGSSRVVKFRQLTENELHIVDLMSGTGDASTWVIGGQDFLVAYRYQNVLPDSESTIVSLLIETRDGEVVLSVGSTKRNPADEPKRIRGEVEAFKRAVASEVVFQLSGLRAQRLQRSQDEVYVGVDPAVGEGSATVVGIEIRETVQ